ncbi:Cytosine/adenosine deaminase [Evansella caseinilytica]|uniref:Cytosine/adenosine deaminase n=1 Tax=Evansella caseinilytica TaxID=1503961 RepID=A0A1H3LWT5_9BACI|nr:amidohydrolase family protein [Evansella caseinilytica]SDY68458.1 Cytosine/adenosine deaminase [Evansella caseinilytica]
MKKLLIKNGYVLDTNSESRHQLQRKDIFIVDKWIRDIQPNLEAAQDTECINAAGKIIIPGFVDTHRHVWESLLRHIGADWTLLTYLDNLYYGNLGSMLTPEDYHLANLWGALEAVDAGVTTVLDWSMLETPEHADAAINGLQTAGIRAVFAHGTPGYETYWSRDSEIRHPSDARRIKKQYFQSDDQLLTMALAIRGPEFSSWETALDDIRLARELAGIASMHIGFGTWGPHDRSITRLHEAEMLNTDLNLVHVNRIQPDEYKYIAESGASLSVTPEIEMMMGHGYPATGRLHKYDGLVTLGVDVVVATAGDMFSQMKFALQAERAWQNEQRLDKGEMPEQLGITATDVLTFATCNGAKALKLDHKIGTIAVGKEADLLFIDTSSFNMFPLNNEPVGAIVQSARPENIDSVFIAGRPLKRNGQLLYEDLPGLRKKVQSASEAIFQRQGAKNQ